MGKAVLALYVLAGPQGDGLGGVQLEPCWQLVSARNIGKCGIANKKGTNFLYSKG